MSFVFLGGMKWWNVDPRGGFKAKVDNQDSTSWGLHFGGSARAKIMKLHGFKNALFSLLILTIWCFWGAIWMVLHCIFIKKPVDVCKKSPPPYGAKNQHVNITKDVCKKSPPEILGSVRGRRLFAHVLGNIDILVPWRRLNRSNLSPNHYSYNVWATSQKSVARRIAGRRKRSDCCKN